MLRRRGYAIAMLCIGVLLLADAVAQPGLAHRKAHRAPTRIVVLSSRADLIAGGQALVQIQLPARATHWRINATLNGRTVTSAFTQRHGQNLTGLVTGLHLGPNVLTVRLPDHTGASITLTNHPIGGPVFAGPQAQPWTCQPGAHDKQCDQAPTYAFFYKSTDATKSGFQPYDPQHPPQDVASTTTDQGTTVPFIVRRETGYQDRDQYKIATLFQPGQPWTSAKPQKQFNHKLLITHGASCDIDYAVGSAPSVTSYDPADLLGLPVSFQAAPPGDSAEYALSKGFAVMSTALDNNGHDCDVVNQAESLVIAKQHLIDTYGTVRYTIGAG